MDKQNVLQKEYSCLLRSWELPLALCFFTMIATAADHSAVSTTLNSV